MKCPKCGYLGFETGDRCKNCGYDFSLISAPSKAPEFDADLLLRPVDDAAEGSQGGGGAVEDVRGTRSTRSPVRSGFPPEEKLPLFSPGPDDSDEPLIKLAAAPRPPLAVRRTPESPRLRAVPKRTRPLEEEPALQFAEQSPSDSATMAGLVADVRLRTTARLEAQVRPPEVSGAASRAAAVAIDHLLLAAIDVTVIYFTVRMAELPMSGWSLLPLAPLAAFLILLKLSYFSVFTAIGGQTIGKMAMRIRVVTAENTPLDMADSLTRSLASTLSAVSLGLGYLPALFGPEHRALHDRLARTRVVALPPA